MTNSILNTLVSGAIKIAGSNGQAALTNVIKNTIEKKSGAIPADGQKDAGAGSPASPVQAADGWDCPCGHKGNTGKFCAECGKPKPAGWDCPCGYRENTGKFCAECGKPQSAGWDCSCGHKGNTGKFCAECGKPKPAGAPQNKCGKCGWQPEDTANLPKFCPECGGPFGGGDVVQ